MPSKQTPVISAPIPQRRTDANFKPLSLPSLDFSLTAGTDIPSPPATPTKEEIDRVAEGNEIVRSPTPGGGPLSSHPTTPVAMPGAYPHTPTGSTELKANRVLGRNPDDEKMDSAHPSQSHIPFPREPSAAALPMSPADTQSSMQGGYSSRRSSILGGKKGGSMRRLFSLRNLYSNSNGSSTDCFSGGMGNASQQLHYDPSNPNRLPRMSSSDSFMAPYRPASSMASQRPDSRMTDASSAHGSRSPGLRKRSSAFFGSSGRRKSGLFLFGGGRVDEDGMIPEDSTAEAEKENIQPPPTIQEVKIDTSIGGEELFRDIK